MVFDMCFVCFASLYYCTFCIFFFFFSSRRRHTRFDCDWSSDVCSSDLDEVRAGEELIQLDGLDTVALGRFPRQIGVVGDDVHAEAERAPRDLGTDASEPHNAQHLAEELTPWSRLFSQRPPLSAASAAGTRRASARSSAMVCSATA